MTSRSDVLASIRRSLGVAGNEATRLAVIDDRLDRAPRGVIPERAQLPAEERLALFRAKVEAASATLASVGSMAEVPKAVAEHLRRSNLPATIRMGSDLRLKAMPWQETTLDVASGPSDGHDLNGLSHAVAGIAETGTLALTSGPENPTTLNFLPDNHIVVIQAKDVVGDLEAMWSKLRFAQGKGEMPRTVNLITGPSRSGDIEQKILLGAHGPRSLHVILVEG